jgi:hypothetical protein
MESIQETIKEILDLKTLLIEKNRQEMNMEKVYQNVEHFFDTIQESWGQLKLVSPAGQYPQEVITFSEDMANYFLDHVDFYFNHINKNHTVKMGELIGKVAGKIQGLSISEKLKRRLERVSENNSWHGH